MCGKYMSENTSRNVREVSCKNCKTKLTKILKKVPAISSRATLLAKTEILFLRSLFKLMEHKHKVNNNATFSTYDKLLITASAQILPNE